MKDVFEQIHKSNRWGNTESVSGTGSTLEQTRVIRTALPELLRRYGIKSILDIPCGDFNWMSQVDLDGIDYTGADIVKAIIEQNAQTHARDFRVLDITSSALPKSDLVFTRDCFVHLPYEAIQAALSNIKASGAKFLLTTTFPRRRNRDIKPGDWRPIDLNSSPFDFPEPREIINEGCTERGGDFADKSLALYELAKVQNAGLLPVEPSHAQRT